LITPVDSPPPATMHSKNFCLMTSGSVPTCWLSAEAHRHVRKLNKNDRTSCGRGVRPTNWQFEVSDKAVVTGMRDAASVAPRERGKSHEHVHHERRNTDLLLGLGDRTTCGVQSRPAAQLRQLGRADALPGLARLPMHRPRPSWSWPIQPTAGRNEMNTYADGEVARYIGRHGTKRVGKAALISSVPPLMLKTGANPGGLPVDVFDGTRAASAANRSQLYRDLASGPFFGFNRPSAKVSQGSADWF
jgi:hypothetical protein